MRERGRLCGALPWTTIVSLSLPRSKSPIRKEEGLDQKFRTDCSLRPGLALSEKKLVAIEPRGAMASTNKSLAQSNKSQDVGKATNKHSGSKASYRSALAKNRVPPAVKREAQEDWA